MLQQFNQAIMIMGVSIDGNKLVIITEPKTINLDLPNDVGKNLKLEIDSIIRHNEFFGGHRIENGIKQLLSKYKHVNYIHEHRKQ